MLFRSSEASVQANEGLALGSNATVNNVRGVALGANSATAAPVSTASETINGLKYNYAGGTADSTVSVGNTSTKRTITNVAAGRVSAQSTDAINGSQLYGVANAVGNVANSTKNILGGNAQVDQNGSITMTNIGDTGKNTVHEAIKSANSGWELQVNGQKVKDVKAPNRTVNFNAGKNIKLEGAGDNVTVATVDNANFNSVTTGSVSMSKTGINAGGYQITNVQSGGDTLTNAANIGDISRIAAKYDKYLQRGSATYEANGNGKINMTGTNGLTAEVTGLKNTYVTSGTVSNDGKRLTLTRNDNQTFDVDISKISNGLSKTDYRLIANPAAGSNGEYKVAADGSMTLTVADADGSNPRQVKLTNLASKEQQDINTTNINTVNNKVESVKTDINKINANITNINAKVDKNSKDIEVRKKRTEELNMFQEKNDLMKSVDVEQEIKVREHLNNNVLDGFEPAKSKTIPRSTSKGGVVGIVNSKSVKKISISREAVTRMDNPKYISISLSRDSFAIGEELPNNNNLLNIKTDNGKAVIYSSELVSEITDKYGLDFGNRTSITFSDVEYIQHNGFTIAIIKVK